MRGGQRVVAESLSVCGTAAFEFLGVVLRDAGLNNADRALRYGFCGTHGGRAHGENHRECGKQVAGHSVILPCWQRPRCMGAAPAAGVDPALDSSAQNTGGRGR